MTYPTHAAVLQAARALFAPGDVVEVRVPKAGRQKTISGYFDDFDKLAAAVASLESARYAGVYWTLNPVNRALLARAENKVKSFAEVTTKDPDILRRRWLPVDLDPKRPAGISSTEAEHAAALELATGISKALQSDGWPEPIYADSGNGAHLLYRIDLPNDEDSEQLLQRVLQALGKLYGSPEVDVDQTTFNPSRIFKTYGTTARKGDNTADRPHRLSQILRAPGELIPVSAELLQAIAALAPAAADKRRPSPASPSRPSHYPDSSGFSVEQFLVRHGIRHRAPVPCDNGRKFVLEECPFNRDHKAPDAAVFDRHDGPGFKCFHSSCAARDWRELRDLFEPGRAYRPQYQQPAPTPAAEPAKSDESDTEIPLTAGDVEAAIDEAIEKKDLIACIRMAPDVANLAPVARAVIKVKLKQAFGKDFPAAEFNKLLQGESSDDPGQKSSGGAPPGDDGGGDDNGDAGTSEGPDLRFFPLTDGGNGERIAALFGQDIRYCVEMKKWLVWDGKRWGVDEFNIMRQKGKQMARTLYLQALESAGIEKHARGSESYAAITAALGQAATEKGIPISVGELDQQPFLLNCTNGVVDLRTGKLLPHKREFLITKLCPVKFDPDAQCPRFLAFVQWAMGGNIEAELTNRTIHLVEFLQRAFGYALTSDVSEKSLFIFHGNTGNNGKTTLLTLFRELLGKDYSGQLVIETVMTSKNQDATMRADLADLRGARFVITSEVEKEHKLSEGKIKYITAGMGDIKSCRKYENPIEFQATHKLFMDCNHRPAVRGVDDAIWARLKLVPFEVRVTNEEKDLRLKDKLRAEMPGILAWAVKGCLAWLKDGLGAPPEVDAAGQEWREHDDPLKEFLDDCCAIGPDLFVAAADLAAGYEWWAKQNRERYPLGREGFNERLQSKGFTQSRSRRIGLEKKQTRTWEGIELTTDVVASIRHHKSPTWREEDT